MGIFQSKNTIYPDDEAYHHLLEGAAEDIQKLVTSIEENMTSFYVRPTSIWYINVPTHDNKEKKLVITSAVFLKMLKRYSVREYITTADGENTLIQFVHEGKSV